MFTPQHPDTIKIKEYVEEEFQAAPWWSAEGTSAWKWLKT